MSAPSLDDIKFVLGDLIIGATDLHNTSGAYGGTNLGAFEAMALDMGYRQRGLNAPEWGCYHDFVESRQQWVIGFTARTSDNDLIGTVHDVAAGAFTGKNRAQWDPRSTGNGIGTLRSAKGVTLLFVPKAYDFKRAI